MAAVRLVGEACQYIRVEHETDDRITSQAICVASHAQQPRHQHMAQKNGTVVRAAADQIQNASVFWSCSGRDRERNDEVE